MQEKRRPQRKVRRGGKPMAQQSFQLVMRSGPTPGKKFLLNKSEITIGRESNNDIIINEAEVSRKHARLLLQPGGYMVEDLGSTNGTYVNEQRLIGPHSLQAGETIVLAENITFIYEPAQSGAESISIGAPGEQLPVTPPPVTVVKTPPEVPEIPRRGEIESEPTYYSGPEEEEYIVDYGYREEEDEEGRRPRPFNNWLLAGCGCFILILCGLIAIFLVLDQMNQLCNPLIRPVTNIILSIINPILGTTYYCP
jgi:hypothetical protein